MVQLGTGKSTIEVLLLFVVVLLCLLWCADDVELLFKYEALSASIVCKSEPLAKLPVSSNVT